MLSLVSLFLFLCSITSLHLCVCEVCLLLARGTKERERGGHVVWATLWCLLCSSDSQACVVSNGVAVMVNLSPPPHH